MSWILLPLVSAIVAAITLLSGFGLGTVLMPAFALFFPVEFAIAATGVVHFVSNVFKLALVGRHAVRDVVVRFGVPAVLAAAVGAWSLARLTEIAPVHVYSIGSLPGRITWVKLLTGALLILFAGLEMLPAYRRAAVRERWLPLGGALSGFFGGLSGMQGALRAPFLLRLGLSKEAYVGSANVISTLVDASRLVAYGIGLRWLSGGLDEGPDSLGAHWGLVAASCGAACVGSVVGARLLRGMSLRWIRRLVAALLFLSGCALLLGIVGGAARSQA